MKKFIFLSLAIMIMMAACSKSDVSPDKKNQDPPPPPPIKEIVFKLVLDVKTQNPYELCVEALVSGNRFGVDNRPGHEICIVPYELVDGLYGQAGKAIPDFHVQIGDAVKDGLVTPDTIVFVAKDTVELRYTLEDPLK